MKSGNPLVIAVDFDGTWTADPVLWRSFFDLLMIRGHAMVIATGRRRPETDAEKAAWDDACAHYNLPNVPVVFCDNEFKERALRLAGYTHVDIWIDDMPGMIQECRILGGAVNDKEL